MIPVKSDNLAEMLMEILDALLSSFDGIRKHGEQLLIEAERTDLELGVKLAIILKDVRSPIAHRQLCGVLLKQYILNHWKSDSPNFRPPEAPEHAKMSIREILPDCLGDAERSVRASAAYAVAAVAAFDWPTQWPNLVEALVNALASSNANLVHGAMHALADLAALITERQNEFQSVLERFSQALFPHLLKILVTHDDTYSMDTRKRGVTVFQTLAKSIFDDKSACKRTLVPWVASYSEALIVCIEATLTTNSTDFDFALRILQTLSWMCEHFARIVALNYGEKLVCLLLHLLRRATEKLQLQLHSAAASDDDSTDLNSVVVELCEMAQSLSGQRQFDQWFSSSLVEVIDAALYLMQISPIKVEEWTDNVAQFIEDEDEDGLVDEPRPAARNLLLSIVEDHGVSALRALCISTDRHLNESEQRRLSADSVWWRQREAALSALGCSADDLIDLIEGRIENDGQPLQLNISSIMSNYVLPGIELRDCPLLCGTCLWLMARLSPVLPKECLQKLITVSLQYLSSEEQIFIRVCVVRALFNLSNSGEGIHLLDDHFAQVVSGLVSLAVLGGEALVGLVLSTLVNLMRENVQLAATVESKLLPLAIACAIRYCGDAVIPSLSVDIVRVLAQSLSIRVKVENRLIPTVVSILDKPEDAKLPMRLPAVAMDLLEALISSVNAPLSPLLLDTAFPSVIGRILRSSDSDILSSGGECVRAFVAVARDQVVGWQSGEGASMIVQVVCHLLSPDSPNMSAAMVSRLIYALLRHAAEALRPYLDQVVQTVLFKMATTQLSSVRQSMLIICCYMFSYELISLIDYLSTLPTPIGNAKESALQFVFADWVDRHRQLISAHNHKVSTLALCKVLEYGVMSGDQRLRFNVGTPPRPVLTAVTALIAADRQHFSSTLGVVSQQNRMNDIGASYEDSDVHEEDDEESGQVGRSDRLADVIASLANDADDLEDDDDPADASFADIDMNVHLTEFVSKLTKEHVWTDLAATLTEEEQQLLIGAR